MSNQGEPRDKHETRRIVVIGGSAAGPKAASRARRLDESADILILQKAPELSMAIECRRARQRSRHYVTRAGRVSTKAVTAVAGGRQLPWTTIPIPCIT